MNQKLTSSSSKGSKRFLSCHQTVPNLIQIEFLGNCGLTIMKTSSSLGEFWRKSVKFWNEIDTNAVRNMYAKLYKPSARRPKKSFNNSSLEQISTEYVVFIDVYNAFQKNLQVYETFLVSYCTS